MYNVREVQPEKGDRVYRCVACGMIFWFPFFRTMDMLQEAARGKIGAW